MLQVSNNVHILLARYCTRKSAKGFETIGLALTLFAGFFYYSNVTFHHKGIETLLDANNKLAGEFEQRKSHLTTQYESHVTRAMLRKGLSADAKKYSNMYVYTWDDGEVRRSWALDAANNNQAITKVLSLITGINEVGNLGLKNKIELVEIRFNTLYKSLSSKIDFKKIRGKRGQTFDASAITIDLVESSDTQYNNILEDMTNIIAEERLILTDRYKKSSSFYEFLFVLGSVLLILAKFIEWKEME